MDIKDIEKLILATGDDPQQDKNLQNKDTKQEESDKLKKQEKEDISNYGKDFLDMFPDK